VRAIAVAAALFLLAVSPSWGGAVGPSASALLNGSVSALSCAAPGECAAGGYYTDGGGDQQAFVVSKTHDRWGKAIEVPGTAALNGGGLAEVTSISCAAVGKCAAGGYYTDSAGNQEAFVVSKKNGGWGNAIRVPGTATLNTGGVAEVSSISCAAAGECAAGGYYGSVGEQAPHAFLVSETNGHWGNAIKVPGLAALDTIGYSEVGSVSCAAPGDCAAAGYYTDDLGNQAFVVSEKNGNWDNAIEVPGTATLNAGGRAKVTSVSCVAAGKCGAAGFYDSSAGQQAFVVSEKNGSWHDAIEIPGIATLNTGGTAEARAISCSAAGECAAGGFYTDDSSQLHAFVVSERSGSWHNAIEVPGTPLGDGDTAMVDSVSCPAAGRCAAGGSSGIAGYTQAAFVVREKNGSWGQAIEVAGTSKFNSGVSAEVSAISCAAVGECAAGGSVNNGTFGQWPIVVSEKSGSWGHAIKVRLRVSCVVPNVVGQAIEEAEESLHAAYCGLGRITYVYSELHKGLVVAQQSRPGKHLSGGTRVALTVSKGKKPRSKTAAPTHATTRWHANVVTGEKTGVDINSISCASPGNCSAVGSYVDDAGNRQGLLLTEKAGRWGLGVEAVLPANASSDPQVDLQSISCASAGNCTAVGRYLRTDSIYNDGSGGLSGLLLTQKAGNWAAGVEAVLPANASSSPWVFLGSVSCASAGNCTAVGTYQRDQSIYTGSCCGYSGLLLTEKAGQWAPGVDATLSWEEGTQTSYSYAALNSVSCAPDGGCSAVGHYTYTIGGGRDSSEAGVAVLLTKKRGTWERVDPVMPPNGPGEAATLTSVSCVSGGNCSATGLYNLGIDQGGGPGGVLLTEKAGAWKRGVMAEPPKGATDPYWANYVGLTGISCSGPGDCVAIGEYYDKHERQHLTMLTETAGKWRRGVKAALPRGAIRQGAVLSAVSCASPGNCTAVGSYRGVARRYGLLLTEIGGSWARGVRAPRMTASFGWVLSVSCGSPGNCGAVGVGRKAGGFDYGVLFDSITEPCVVPMLKGKTVRSARRSIRSHGCSTGTIELARSSTVAAGRVISQTPQPGRHLASFTKINLTLSSGTG